MNEPHIQFPPLPLSQVNVVLEAIAQMPLARVYEVYGVLHSSTKQQVEELQRSRLQPIAPPDMPAPDA